MLGKFKIRASPLFGTIMTGANPGDRCIFLEKSGLEKMCQNGSTDHYGTSIVETEKKSSPLKIARAGFAK